MAKVSLDHITKIFKGNVEAVKDVTLEIPDKALVAFLGPSGCGKTTTLRMIAGLETPTAGRVYIDDEDVTEMPPRERDVAMIFQFAVVYPALSVFDNIAFPLKAQKLTKSEIERRVKETAEILGLSSILYEKPIKMDMSVKQRVAIARAIVRKRKVYLLDEPLTNLDPADRVRLRKELKRLQKDLNQTMIFVTHDQSEALTLADKIAVMNKGRVVQYDTSENIYHYPQDAFVAWFVGDPGSNLIDCSYEKEKEKMLLKFAGFTLDVTEIARQIDKGASSTELILGIRPELVEISPKQRGSEWISSKCVLIEPIGDICVLHMKVEDQIIKVGVPSTFKVSIGDKFWIRLPKRYLRVFDKKTGKLIATFGQN